MEKVIRFDFNGTQSGFKRTPQGFLRVKARLSKTGIFNYDKRREFRSDSEVFDDEMLSSLKGAPVTDLHPKERGGENFLSPANAKDHIIGITEDVERDGPYLKGSLIIFHEDSIKAIESGERKEVSLGYECNLLPNPGVFQGESYDFEQKNLIVNHVALGPEGWGRAGRDCVIRTDSKTTPTRDGINFVGCGAVNNAVRGRVIPPRGTKVFKKGLITVSGKGSTMASSVQTRDFVTSQQVYAQY
jgi:hypothetical protein